MSTRWSTALYGRPDRLVFLYFLALGLAAFPPTLGAGYLLQLDMVFAPGASYLDFLIAEKGTLYYGRLPFAVLLDILTFVMADWIVQRILLIAAVTGSGLALYLVTRGLSYPARIVGGTLYAINPFIYIRLLAGQWYIVLAYAALPLAVFSFYEYVRGERKRPTGAIVWTTVVAIFDPHLTIVLVLLGVCVLVMVWRADGRQPLIRSVIFGVLAAGVNAYWLLPAAIDTLSGTSPLTTIGQEDLIAFNVQGVVQHNVPLSVVMLYGFWRDGYTYPFDIVPFVVVLLCFVLLLFLVVYGCFARADPLRNALVLGAVIGGILAVGVTSAWTAPFVSVLVETPFGAGMRETGKFVAMIALAYAFLAARGVDAILAQTLEVSRRADTGVTLKRYLPLILAVLLILTPLAYTFPMVAGFWGGFSPTEYPDDWEVAADTMDLEADQRVLALPWHQYIVFDWADGTVANPTPMYFGDPVVSSHDPDLGIGTLATDPTRERVRTLLSSDDEAAYAPVLAELGIEYVVLLKVAEYEQYAFLYDDPSMEVVMDGETIAVFRNEAFVDAPPVESWPEDGSEFPVFSVVAGTLLTFGSIVTIARFPLTGEGGSSALRR